MGSALQELESINLESKRIFLEKYRDLGISDKEKLAILRNYIQVCKVAKGEAAASDKFDWDSKPWWEKL